MKIKPVLRWLLAPRTDSPTVAYYAGLFSGVVLTLEVMATLKQIREIREMEEAWKRSADEQQSHLDNFEIDPDI